jgi:hypothetical protein
LTYGSAAVSNVLKPAPTTNMLPQKPPNDCFNYSHHQRPQTPSAIPGQNAYSAGPEQQAPDAQNDQTAHEGNAESIAAQDPARDGEGAEEISAKVGSRETGALGISNFEKIDKVVVQDVQETVGEAPEKEETCNCW